MQTAGLDSSPLMQLGFDSSQLMLLRRELSAIAGRGIDAAFLFRNQTAEDIVVTLVKDSARGIEPEGERGLGTIDVDKPQRPPPAVQHYDSQQLLKVTSAPRTCRVKNEAFPFCGGREDCMASRRKRQDHLMNPTDPGSREENLLKDKPAPAESTYSNYESYSMKGPCQRAPGNGDESGKKFNPADHPLDDDIAIVGLSCRYPGNANSPGMLWERLIQPCKSGIQPHTGQRWTPERDSTTDFVGLLDNADWC